jgi:hypothetical protein
MSDQQDRVWANPAQGLPTFLAAFVAVLEAQVAGIIKYMPSQFEADAMLLAVGFILARISFEPHPQIVYL